MQHTSMACIATFRYLTFAKTDEDNSSSCWPCFSDAIPITTSSCVGKESILSLKSGQEHRVLRKVFEPAFAPTAIMQRRWMLLLQLQRRQL